MNRVNYDANMELDDRAKTVNWWIDNIDDRFRCFVYQESVHKCNVDRMGCIKERHIHGWPVEIRGMNVYLCTGNKIHSVISLQGYLWCTQMFKS